MNHEDAIKVLKSLVECLSIDCDDDCEHCHIQLDGITAVVEACAVAVTELSQIDIDTVSRQGAIEAVKEALDPNIVSFVKAKIAIENLPPSQLIQPPAQPDRKNVDGYLFNLYRNGLSLIGPESVVSREHWIKQLYEAIFGKGERPVWMRKDKEE